MLGIVFLLYSRINRDTIRRDKRIGARHIPRDLDLRVEINYRRRRCRGQLTGRAWSLTRGELYDG